MLQDFFKKLGKYKIGRKKKFFIYVLLGIPVGLVVKNWPANEGDTGSIPDLGKSSREGNGNPLQYSCLAIPTDRGGWWATVHVVTQSQTQQSNWTAAIIYSSRGLPWWLSGKESTCQCRRYQFEPWSQKIPWRRKSHSLHGHTMKTHSMKMPMDGRTQWARVHAVAKSWTPFRD